MGSVEPAVVQTQIYGPVCVNATFDSGNIEVVDVSNPKDIRLKIRKDPFCVHDNKNHYQCALSWLVQIIQELVHNPCSACR